MFVFKTVVLVLAIGLQMLVAGAACSFPSTQLTAPASCDVTWKADEADSPLPETFPNCYFSKQHIIATLDNGVDWEIWENPNETGPPAQTFDLGSATFYSGVTAGGVPSAAYHADWSNSGDFISRAGLQFEKAHPTQPGKMRKGCTYTKYGKMTAEYRFTKSGQNTAGGYSYVGVYGWARNPLVEYYIIDDWFGNAALNPATTPVPPATVCNDVDANACKIGEYDLDGGKYVLYSKTRGPAYSISGPNQCFLQIYAVRTETRQCGTIHIDEHFKKWEESECGLVLNEMYEAKILVEAGGGTGWIDFTHLTVTKQSDCTDGEIFDAGTYPTDTYSCPAAADMPPPPNNQIKYCVPPKNDDDGAASLWNRKAWVGMIVLWVVFLLFQ